MIARIGRGADGDALLLLLAPLSLVARYVSGSSSAVSLLGAGASVGLFHIGAGALWMTWGLAGILFTLLLGAFLIRREIRALATGSSARLSRPTALNLVNLTLLLSVIWAMVDKPA